MPPFIQRPTLCACPLEFVLGVAPVNVLRCKQERKAVYKNLLGRPAEKTFGAGVPRRNPALVINLKDCIVPNAFDHHAELRLAPPYGLFRRFTSRVVPNIELDDGLSSNYVSISNDLDTQLSFVAGPHGNIVVADNL